MKYLNYLICGISLLSLLITSCKDDHIFHSTWIYINETDSPISFEPNRSEFNIGAKDTIIFTESGEGEEDMTAFNFVPPNRPFVVYFGNSLCDTLISGSSANKGEALLGIENYESREDGKNNFTFTFRFTKTMLGKAKRCR